MEKQPPSNRPGQVAGSAGFQKTEKALPSQKILCSELVELRWTTHSGENVHCTANLEEIWREGATLELEQPLLEKRTIQLIKKPACLEAKVLYCRDNGGGFTAGIRFAAGNEWHAGIFLPDHALNPAELRSNDTEAATPEEAAPEKAKGASASSRSQSPIRGWMEDDSRVASLVVEQGSLFCLGVYASTR